MRVCGRWLTRVNRAILRVYRGKYQKPLKRRSRDKVFREEKGFTLVELITVVAIIAILGAVVAPNIIKAIEGSRVVAAISDVKIIKNAALAYYADTGQWPRSPENGSNSDLGFLVDPDPGVNGWNGPYLESWPPKNPWGGVYSLSYSEAEEKLSLQLSQVPASALDKLQEKLGEKIKDEENGNVSIPLVN